MLTDEQIATIKKRNAVIAEANRRLDALKAAKVKCSAREAMQGVEIKIERPGFGNRPYTSYEIIPWLL